MGEILDVIEETNGRLNFNDALLVALQRERQIDEVASFDRGSDTGQGGHPDSAKRS